MDIAKLISGRVGKIGNRYSVSLNLFDTQNARAEKSVSEFGHSEDELIDLLQVALGKLLGVEISPTRVEQRPAPSSRTAEQGLTSKSLTRKEPGLAGQWHKEETGDLWVTITERQDGGYDVAHPPSKGWRVEISDVSLVGGKLQYVHRQYYRSRHPFNGVRCDVTIWLDQASPDRAYFLIVTKDYVPIKPDVMVRGPR
jgi:hypothetical protein